MTPPLPRLYSFRRCPYAMRARMALLVSGVSFSLTEVSLKAKPPAMLAASPKGTVPVLIFPGGQVLDESLDIMRWALGQNDPENWLVDDREGSETHALIARNDGPFKHHLDRYKYATRYSDDGDAMSAAAHRAAAMEILVDLDTRLAGRLNLVAERPTLADIALFPFVRQFARHDPDWWASQPFAHLQQWLERHLSSPLFQIAIRKDASVDAP
ncbi:glutathione S-transferase [Sphingomonas cavernae]|uniref:Glutathione S-transferase n=2 Tax=Sphingomonas cavernae TaxID=2320861 RepID=A0A418WNM5_9SPHN|nr:glutathione S-transferase [Sphingomonas cavernae]